MARHGWSGLIRWFFRNLRDERIVMWVPLGDNAMRKRDYLRPGTNEIVCCMNYNQRSGLEAMYLLSSRAVTADSRGSTLFPAPQALRMEDIAQQGFPFYSAGVRYRQMVNIDLAARERAFIVLRKWAGVAVVVDQVVNAITHTLMDRPMPPVAMLPPAGRTSVLRHK